MSRNEFRRWIFLDSRRTFSPEFSQIQIAKFLSIARLFINHCKAQAEENKTAEAKREAGDTAFLRANIEQIIQYWLHRPAATHPGQY
jgi:hypothetical protein